MTPLDRPNLVSRLVLPCKFLKNNNKRKDQMQKEKKLYATVGNFFIYVQWFKLDLQFKGWQR